MLISSLEWFWPQKLQYGSPKMHVLGRAFAKPITVTGYFFLATVVLLVFDCILNVYRFSVHIQYAEKIEIEIGFGAFWRIFVSQR